MNIFFVCVDPTFTCVTKFIHWNFYLLVEHYVMCHILHIAKKINTRVALNKSELTLQARRLAALYFNKTALMLSSLDFAQCF
jgi:hypothetical protein